MARDPSVAKSSTYGRLARRLHSGKSPAMPAKICQSSLSRSTSSPPSRSPRRPAPPNWPLVGWWPLNEGRGQTAYDWSGKGNHGQLGSTAGVDANDPTWIKGRWFGQRPQLRRRRLRSHPALRGRARAADSSRCSLWFRGHRLAGRATSTSSRRAGTPAPPPHTASQTSWNGGLAFIHLGRAASHPARVRPSLSPRCGTASGITPPARGTERSRSSSSTAARSARAPSSPGTIDYGLPGGRGHDRGLSRQLPAALHGRSRQREDLEPGAPDRRYLAPPAARCWAAPPSSRRRTYLPLGLARHFPHVHARTPPAHRVADRLPSLTPPRRSDSLPPASATARAATPR